MHNGFSHNNLWFNKKTPQQHSQEELSKSQINFKAISEYRTRIWPIFVSINKKNQ